MNCLLCQQMGDECEPIYKVIHTYIHDNSGIVHEREIAKQVTELLQDKKNINFPPERVLEHMRFHLTNQRVVLDKLLRDLIDISSITRQASIVPAADTNDNSSSANGIDKNMLQLHLKIVDQIGTLYRLKQ